jgi:general secretion pathway protein B
MSILLDALKKSEEQRQLGRTPNIHSPVGESMRETDAGAQWVPLAMMTLAAIAMAWLGWQQFRLPPEIATAAPVETAAGEPAGEIPQPEVAAPPPDAAGEAAMAAADEPGGPPTADLTARRPQAIADPASRTPVESFKADTRALRDAKVMPPPDEQAAEPSAERAVARTAAPGEAAEQSATGAEAGAAADGPVAATEQPRVGRATPHVPEPISYWELPQGVRDELPELRLTVVVYAERPEDRFVLINGQRFTEQEIVESGVVLEEIRRNGAVLQYRSYRFLVEG